MCIELFLKRRFIGWDFVPSTRGSFRSYGNSSYISKSKFRIEKLF